MAAKKRYPQDKSLAARMEAILESHAQTRNALNICKQYVLESLGDEVGDELRKRLEGVINDALAANALASAAIAGDP
jgi:hypothetical protein